jgi:Tol biopolymer transport system component
VLSRLSIFDVDGGAIEWEFSTDRHIEAPNWMPDGEALIVNGDGRLYRTSLTAPALVEIDTGFAVNINNDHGVSPDGRSIAISDSSETGASLIYTLPLSGGQPKKITANAPSYWHGWSPDGGTLVYVGKRHATFQVFACPSVGGSERQLTSNFDHCDGPEYTPDGQWIWFNGEKAGEVQLWRMRHDGNGLERMTNNPLVKWFPHPSPDGRLILYLVYESGTRGHPAMRPVELHLMPSQGGESTPLIRLTGGQGTINVPCWAPGAKKFAFVQYEE